MTLTDDHLHQYREEGYTLVRGLIPRQPIEAARERIVEVAGGANDWPAGRFQSIDPARYTNPDGSRVPQGVQRPALQEQVFMDVAAHPNLQAAMAGLLGGAVELFTDQIGLKHGFVREEQGGRTFYHQDSYYWHIDPHLGCNCWIPFADVDRDAIALAVIPRSHAGWRLDEHESYYDDPPMFSGSNTEPFKRHRIPLDRVDYSRETLVPMQPGDGLFFTNYTWHRSEPNRTGRTLGFYAIAYRRKA